MGVIEGALDLVTALGSALVPGRGIARIRHVNVEYSPYTRPCAVADDAATGTCKPTTYQDARTTAQSLSDIVYPGPGSQESRILQIFLL